MIFPAAPAAIMNLIAALGQNAGMALPLELSQGLRKFLPDPLEGPTNQALYAADEPNCDTEWIDVGMCIYGADPTGAMACHNCIEAGLEDIDPEEDFCTQLEEDAEDPAWCTAATACIEGCGKTIAGTATACETAWEGILECYGITEEELRAEMSEPECPGLCEGEFAVAAM